MKTKLVCRCCGGYSSEAAVNAEKHLGYVCNHCLENDDFYRHSLGSDTEDERDRELYEVSPH